MSLLQKVLDFKGISKLEFQKLIQKPQLFDASKMTQIREAVQVIKKHQNHKVLIVGDYDADGICATTITYKMLLKLNYQVNYYIPNRLKEGYGLNSQIVTKAKEANYQLIICVDNGIRAYKAIDLANQLGIEVLVVDHHSYDYLPKANIFHSFLNGDEYYHFSGATMALALSLYLNTADKNDIILATIALLADLMDLSLTNRELIKLGIEYLTEGNYPQIQLLRKYAKEWNEDVISFEVVAKLNACGRMSDYVNINQIVKYLLLEDIESINTYSQEIEKINNLRKAKVETSLIDANLKLSNDHFQIIIGDYHLGLVGLMANNLLNQSNKATLVMSELENSYKGSARSFNNLDLVSLFSNFPGSYLAFGGHKQAIALEIAKDQYPSLKSYLNKTIMDYDLVSQETYIDVTFQDLTIENLKELEILRPFGQGFSKPKFKLSQFFIYHKSYFANHKHLKLIIDHDIEVIYFNYKKNYSLNTIIFNQWEIKTFRNKKCISIIAI